LIEHLPDVVGEQVIHRSPLVDNSNPFSTPAQHPVYIEADSRLSRMIGAVEIDSVSWHHQAVRQVAPGLSVVARAADGTIEAVEKPDHPWLIAVPWHPEMSAQVDPVQQRLFDAFVRVAAGQAEVSTASATRF
jgi:putative glutamine amidotransferase